MDSTLDYAGRSAETLRRFWPLPRRWKISIGLVLCVVVVSATLFKVHHYRVLAASLTSLGGNQGSSPDGRKVQIWIAGNANHRTAVVLVLQHITADPKGRVLEPVRVYSSSDPIRGLQSSWRLRTRYPPDPAASGVWVDGQRRRVSDRLLVVYLSDKQPATDIAIREADQATFLADAGSLDPLLFVDKWIKPRLPSPGK